MQKSKKEKRAQFVKKVKQSGKKEIDTKTMHRIEPEPPSEIALRILKKELQGRIGKKDIDEER